MCVLSPSRLHFIHKGVDKIIYFFDKNNSIYNEFLSKLTPCINKFKFIHTTD